MHGGTRFAQGRGVGSSGEHNMSYQPGRMAIWCLCFTTAIRWLQGQWMSRMTTVAETTDSDLVAKDASAGIKRGNTMGDGKHMAKLRLCYAD
jgi:hypothetical protein